MSQVGGMLQAISMPLVSLVGAVKNGDEKKEQTGGGSLFSFDGLLSLLTTLAFMMLAGYLCWKCNEKTEIFLKVIYVILAVVFNWLYLIYYFIWRYLLKHTCETVKQI